LTFDVADHGYMTARGAIPTSMRFPNADGEGDLVCSEPPQVIPLWAIQRALLIILGRCALLVRADLRHRTDFTAWYPDHPQDSLAGGVRGRGRGADRRRSSRLDPTVLYVALAIATTV
jgi:hypothetical protein